MTVKQVIEKLSKFPENMPVVVHGYEDGYDLADRIIAVPAAKKQGMVHWYVGVYDGLTKGDANAVLIASNRRWKTDDDE
jgi:hypothetical protein